LAGGIAEAEMQRMQTKLLPATGDHTAAEDGHQQALAVVRRWRIIAAALTVKKLGLIRSDGRRLPY
jgi:hypothetical protein